MTTTKVQRISTFLWFSSEAEAAASYYTSIFPNSKITSKTHYNPESEQVSGQRAGSVMTVSFELDGQHFTALNGGPVFKFTEAISLVVNCQSQEEVDYFWDKLSEGGDPKAQQCGWLKDKFGLSWQIVPTELQTLLADPEKGRRVTEALMKMRKLDLPELRKAAA
jgi:predicted 3-demethylubiquinone-9 3-methyltransferase (glyoxalase superfamily)